MKKIILLMCVFITMNSFSQELNASWRKFLLPKSDVAPSMPKSNLFSLKSRAASTIDTITFGHMFYTAVYAKANGFGCPGNRYTSLGTTSLFMTGLTNYINPVSDGRYSEIFTIYDTIYDVGLSTSNTLVRKGYLLDSAISVWVDTVQVICGLAPTDTAGRNFNGDTISFSLYTVDKTSKTRQSLVKQINYTSKADMDSFYNGGFIYYADVPFNTYLPAGTSAFGVLIEYKTTHKDSNLFLVAYNRLDSCNTVVIGGQNFSSPSMKPLFPNYTQWKSIDSVSPTVANTVSSNNNVPFSISTLPLNCKYPYTQNYYILPRIVMQNKFYGYLSASPGTSSVCVNSHVIISPNFSGGKEPFTYLWTASSGTIDNPTDPAIDLTMTTSPSNIKLVIKDANGDTLVLTKTIGVSNPTAAISLNKPNLTSCSDSVILTANMSGGTPSIYSWSNGASTTNKLTVNSSGTYSVTITSNIGCTATATSSAVGATFALPPVLDFTFSPSSNICPNKTVDFTVTPNATRANWNYTFKDGATVMGTTTSVSYSFTTSGSKSVSLSADSGACKATTVSKSFSVLSSTDPKCKVGINENVSDNIKVYPNPVKNGELYVQNDMNQALDVRVVDILGKVVYADKLTPNKTNTINLSSANNGVYFVEIEGRNDKSIRKVLVDKQ